MSILNSIVPQVGKENKKLLNAAVQEQIKDIVPEGFSVTTGVYLDPRAYMRESKKEVLVLEVGINRGHPAANEKGEKEFFCDDHDQKELHTLGLAKKLRELGFEAAMDSSRTWKVTVDGNNPQALAEKLNLPDDVQSELLEALENAQVQDRPR